MASSNYGISLEPKEDLVTLLSYGTRYSEEVLELYAEKGLLNITDKDGITPLMVACWRGFVGVVEILLENGANLNSKTPEKGNTPMHYACMEENKSSYVESSRERMTRKVSIVKLLLNHEMLQNGLDIKNKDGQTPLMFACLGDLEDVVKFLLDNGANPSLISLKEGTTPLHYACMEDDDADRREYSIKRKIRKVSVVKLLLLRNGELRSCLDVKNKDGQTPLMFAVLFGFKDVVKLLLENGANPNSKSLTEANTPLHYACTVAKIGDTSLETFDFDYDQPFQAPRSRVPIVELLLSYGAISVDNSHGWSPPCVAAFHLQNDVVDHFLAMDKGNIPWEDRIKVVELLGVSYALILKDTDCKDISNLFSIAILTQQLVNRPTAHPVTSELEIRFSKFWKECHTEGELESIKQSKLGLKAHAFLIGERLYPQTFKKQYLYPLLVGFARELHHKEMWDEFYLVMSCALGFEHHGELELGTVLSELEFNYYEFQYAGKEPKDPFLHHARNLLWEYENVLQQVHIDSLSAKVDSIIENFAEILFSEAFYCPTDDSLQSTVLVIEKLVRIIRGRIRKENTDKFHEMYSVAYELTSHLHQSFDDFKKFHEGILVNSLPRARFVILKMLFSESACHTDRVGYLHDSIRRDTLLHLMARCALKAQYFKTVNISKILQELLSDMGVRLMQSMLMVKLPMTSLKMMIRLMKILYFGHY